MANKIAEKNNISNRFTNKTITNTEEFPEVKKFNTRNITELLRDIPDIELLGEMTLGFCIVEAAFSIFITLLLLYTALTNLLAFQ